MSRVFFAIYLAVAVGGIWLEIAERKASADPTASTVTRGFDQAQMDSLSHPCPKGTTIVLDIATMTYRCAVGFVDAKAR